MTIGGFLLTDRAQLSKWIQGLQHGFGRFFLSSKQLIVYTSDLEILKEFLTIKIEQLQLSNQKLSEEKEDYQAMHSSSSSIKEHLTNQLNDLNI